MFYFEPFPIIPYKLFGDDGNEPIRRVPNIALRFRITTLIKDRTKIYYNHVLEDNERLDHLAQRYYDDSSLAWIIAITNDIMDIDNDMPMDYVTWRRYLDKKYGSIADAKGTVHHYEQILNSHQRLSDGTIIPEKYITVDLTTYNSLSPTDRREIDSYTYEERINEAKRNIIIPDERTVPGILSAVDSIFRQYR